jgi:hypothetical protein
MFIPPAPTPGSQQVLDALVPQNLLVLKYRQLRDKKKALDDAHAQVMKPYNEALQAIENMLLDHLNRTGGESVRTSEGTFYKSTTVTYKIDNPGVLRAYIEQHGLTDLYTNALSKEAVEELLKRGQPLPPGIAVSSFTRVNIRKA